MIRTLSFSFEIVEKCMNSHELSEGVADDFDNDMNHLSDFNFQAENYNCTIIETLNCKNLCMKRKFLDDFGCISLAIAAALSMIRLIYWFQLSEKVGPVVINISRVVTTIFSTICTYAIIVIAFSFGVVFVLANDEYSEQAVTFNDTSYSAYYNTFERTFYVLFDAILDPGQKDEDLQITRNSLRGWVATIMVALYELVIIIVLLNLLIAVMNATVQKVYNQKQLYWKFARTRIWIEYFDPENALPIPFSILLILGTFFRQLVNVIKYCRNTVEIESIHLIRWHLDYF